MTVGNNKRVYRQNGTNPIWRLYDNCAKDEQECHLA